MQNSTHIATASAVCRPNVMCGKREALGVQNIYCRLIVRANTTIMQIKQDESSEIFGSHANSHQEANKATLTPYLLVFVHIGLLVKANNDILWHQSLF